MLIEPRTPQRDVIGRLGEPRLLFAFALSLPAGLAMVGLGWLFLDRILQYPSYIGDRYYGPPIFLVVLWIGCGVAVTVSSALMTALPLRLMVWGKTVVVASCLYTLFIASWFAAFTLPYAFFAALLPVGAGLLGLAGGTIAVWKARESLNPRLRTYGILGMSGAALTLTNLLVFGDMVFLEEGPLPLGTALVVLVTSFLLDRKPNRHAELATLLVASSAAQVVVSVATGHASFTLSRVAYFGVGATLGIVAGCLAFLWKPSSEEPISHRPGKLSRWRWGRGPLAESISLAGGIGMLGIALLSLEVYLRLGSYQTHVPDLVFIVPWLEYGVAAVAGSILLFILPRHRVAWALVLMAVSAAYPWFFVLLDSPHAAMAVVTAALGLVGATLALVPAGFRPGLTPAIT